jgi:hypothetical protein
MNVLRIYFWSSNDTDIVFKHFEINLDFLVAGPLPSIPFFARCSMECIYIQHHTPTVDQLRKAYFVSIDTLMQLTHAVQEWVSVIARNADRMHGENVCLAYSLLDDMSRKGSFMSGTSESTSCRPPTLPFSRDSSSCWKTTSSRRPKL